MGPSSTTSTRLPSITVGSVTVTGPPLAICSRKIGTTLPADSSTLPNRTMANFVSVERVARSCTTSSASRLEAPITLVGRTALSVEIITNPCA